MTIYELLQMFYHKCLKYNLVLLRHRYTFIIILTYNSDRFEKKLSADGY